ncbi:fasciclin domain-containing protein [Pedobacter cryophilus]|uniref:Fasciclin domain-containing protein n=1 Tax=Pedobacter cryophilus TaxID=2571271 RepID=A0A4U1C599_9SPHI|nr:fasciclin domain-containing protein [Pedobacter cryophilus]TKC01080.1 fasciclin domain-containing protein [Pedobacter cryophilus]
MKNINPFNSKFSIAAIALFIAFGFTACKKDSDVSPTIAQVAVTMPGFSQLEAAAIRGGVAVVLSNKNAGDPSGAFTVFAPTNDAFAKLGLVNPQDLNVLQKSFLTNVLLYHVNNGNTLQTSLTGGASVSSLLVTPPPATPVTKRIINRNGEFFVNGSKILATNVKADNGTIHVIDRVLLASGANIAQTTIFFAEGKGFVNPELTYLLEAVLYCDLAGALSDANAKYTVFAPTNQAFRDLGQLLGVPLNQPSDIRKLPKATVTQVLLTHVFNLSGGGKFTSELNAGTITALNDQVVTLGAYTNGYLTVKGRGNSTAANMAIPDVQTTNGVVHVIDRVLLPQ